MKFLLRSLILLSVSFAFAVDTWNSFSRTDSFYQAALVDESLVLATDGGVRIINSEGASGLYSSEDGLESSEIYGVVYARATQQTFAISSKGVISLFIGDGKFVVRNRSMSSAGATLIPGLAVAVDTNLVLGFDDRLAFFDYNLGKYLQSVYRIGKVSLKSLSPSALLVNGDSLFVALGAEVYVRKMQWKSMQNDVALADPATWTLAASFDNGDTAKKMIRHIFWDGKKLSASFDEYLSPVIALGKTLSSPSKVKQVVENDDIAYLVGNDSAWFYNGSKVSNVSEWTPFPLTRPYTVIPFIGGNGGGTVYSEMGEFGWSDGEVFSSQEPEKSLPHYGITEPSTRLLKNLSGLSDKKILVGIWGFGWRLYAENGEVLEADVNSSTGATCAEQVLTDFVVPEGVTAAPDSSGWFVSYWGKSSYGIAFIDEAGNASCANQVGTGKYSGPLLATWSEDSTSWILYSGAGKTEGVEGYGSLDIFDVKPVSQTGGELSISSKSNIPTPGHYVLIDLDKEKSGRLWGITYSDFAYYEPGMDSMQAPHKTDFYEQSRLSALAVDPNGRLWVGTSGTGAYMIQRKGTSPDTMKATHFLSRNGLLNDLIYDVTIDTKQGQVWFVHRNGLTRYARTDLRETESFMTSDGPEIKVYPNPVRFDLGQTVTFENVAESVVISIYNSGAHLVRSFAGSELDGGRLVWDGRDKRDVLIAPGVYQYLIKKGGKTKKGKLLVIH